MAPSLPPSEASLLAAAAAGDRQAFAELVRAHQSGVRSQLRGLTHGDAALADDLAQEVFVQAWRHLGEFRGDARFATWLYRIAYRCFLMQRRVQREVQAAGIDDANLPEHSLDERTPQALRLDVARAIAQLNEAERVAIIHCYHLDLSHDEAAGVLGLPLGTLKSQVARGKARLRRLLADWAPENVG